MLSKVVEVENWGSFLLQQLFSFYTDKEHCDLILMCNKEMFNVHRAVVCASSKYFRNVKNDTEVVVLPTDVSVIALKELISFMYTGKLQITSENKEDIIALLQLIEIPVLSNLMDGCNVSENGIKSRSRWSEEMFAESLYKGKFKKSIIRRTDSISNTMKFPILPSMPVLCNNYRPAKMNEISKPLRFDIPENKVKFYYSNFDDLSYDSEPFNKDLLLERNGNCTAQNASSEDADGEDEDVFSNDQEVHSSLGINDCSSQEKFIGLETDSSIPYIFNRSTAVEEYNDDNRMDWEENATDSAKQSLSNENNNKSSPADLNNAASTATATLLTDSNVNNNDAVVENSSINDNCCNGNENNKNKTDPKETSISAAISCNNTNTNSDSGDNNVNSNDHNQTIVLNSDEIKDLSNYSNLIQTVIKKFPLLATNKRLRLKINTANLKSDTFKPLLVKNRKSLNSSDVAKNSESSVAAQSLQSSTPTVKKHTAGKVNTITATIPLNNSVRPNKRHKLSVENVSGPWECFECRPSPDSAVPLRLTNYHSYRKHLRERHNINDDGQYCEYCGFRASRKNVQMHHLYTKHGITPAGNIYFPKCDKCNYIGISRLMLEKHARLHANNKKGHECATCKVTFDTRHELNEHVSKKLCSSTARREYRCSICAISVDRMINLKAHVRINHRHLLSQLNKLTEFESGIVEVNQESVNIINKLRPITVNNKTVADVR